MTIGAMILLALTVGLLGYLLYAYHRIAVEDAKLQGMLEILETYEKILTDLEQIWDEPKHSPSEFTEILDQHEQLLEAEKESRGDQCHAE